MTNDMTTQEELLLLSEAKAGKEKARAAIVEKYDRLCHKLAHKFAFTAPNHDHEDLVQSGRIGLLHAIDSFDPNNGAKFMTWAYYHVRGCVAGCGRTDQKQPAFPKSIEDADRQYNLEDPSQQIEVREEFTEKLIIQIISDCCGGLHVHVSHLIASSSSLLATRFLAP